MLAPRLPQVGGEAKDTAPGVGCGATLPAVPSSVFMPSGRAEKTVTRVIAVPSSRETGDRRVCAPVGSPAWDVRADHVR